MTQPSSVSSGNFRTSAAAAGSGNNHHHHAHCVLQHQNSFDYSMSVDSGPEAGLTPFDSGPPNMTRSTVTTNYGGVGNTPGYGSSLYLIHSHQQRSKSLDDLNSMMAQQQFEEQQQQQQQLFLQHQEQERLLLLQQQQHQRQNDPNHIHIHHPNVYSHHSHSALNTVSGNYNTFTPGCPQDPNRSLNRVMMGFQQTSSGSGSSGSSSLGSQDNSSVVTPASGISGQGHGLLHQVQQNQLQHRHPEHLFHQGSSGSSSVDSGDSGIYVQRSATPHTHPPAFSSLTSSSGSSGSSDGQQPQSNPSCDFMCQEFSQLNMWKE